MRYVSILLQTTTCLPRKFLRSFIAHILSLSFTLSHSHSHSPSHRGMVMPDDKNIAWANTLGMGAVLAVVYAGAFVLSSLSPSLLEVMLACFGLSLAALMVINYYNRSLYESNTVCRTWCNRAILAFAVAIAGGVVLQMLFNASLPASTSTKNSASPASTLPAYVGNSPHCLAAISQGHWIETRCDTDGSSAPPMLAPPLPGAPRVAFCQNAKWVWETDSQINCPVSKLSTSRLRAVYAGKRVLFAGDSEVRNVYHQFISILDPAYKQNITTLAKHSNLHYQPAFDKLLAVDFVWAPLLSNITSVVRISMHSSPHYDLVATGAACWDALAEKGRLSTYSDELKRLAAELTSPAAAAGRNSTKLVWLQPTTVHTQRLVTEEKRQFMSEEAIQMHRAAFLASPAAAAYDTVLDTSHASEGKSSAPVDGLHYTDDVYEVIAHMVSNGYTAHFPALNAGPAAAPKKPYVPKVTGSMSFPSLGALVLALAAVMLFTMDSFLGIGYLSLLLSGRSYDWEGAYGALHRKILAGDSGPGQSTSPASGGNGGGGGGGHGGGGHGHTAAAEGDLENDSLLEMKTNL